MSMVSSVNCICLSSGRVVKSRGPAYEDVLPTESRKVSADILLSFFMSLSLSMVKAICCVGIL